MTPIIPLRTAVYAGVTLGTFCAALFTWFLWFGTEAAFPHEAKTVAGEPIGINYPANCCNSAATSPTGDCAPISDLYVTERSDGYHVDLPVGAHPKLITKGYHGVVPYSTAKRPISNDYHICLSTDGAMRFCFFPKPGAV